ncbi:SpoIID/LytB domain-containing protein [Dysgonomonas sp. 511]|uniref:SpoIID/LytB domain-containing protein n=1 Tax=Dysgonomonas sp. 511 TaxID=2302930 RepID=UPI0013D27090|nr:SpoIID/LytB domain-containing protein [Dysgonomonas sp. 511]NDV78104.1 SpoIID/LytB domain-containing protein [Dysgonomonas sp. 511]
MEPKLRVGILQEEMIAFSLKGSYLCNRVAASGDQQLWYQDGRIQWNGNSYSELYFDSQDGHSSFILRNVVIGINFHWERKEDQEFSGSLKFIVEDGKIRAINVIGIEDYLTSVISSEMSATASPALLKAHAVISRSWLLAQIEKNKVLEQENKEYKAGFESEDEIVRWYDREDHHGFDVCADDHCQRYQGITRTYSNLQIVKEAIGETRGKVLTYDGAICDARFYKCCGGALEEFQNCWEDAKHPYLVKMRDSENPSDLPDLTNEEEAVKWITGSPVAFCNTKDKKILAQVLNNYDQETVDFYRWQVCYSQAELSALAKERSGIDFGLIEELIPLGRGTSGRIIRLKIIGTKKTMIIGKELEIRRILSTSHLYSSAFVVSKKDGQFTLTGAGWGHGVGLCQIGAAVMGEKGYSYKEILAHYYVGAALEKKY